MAYNNYFPAGYQPYYPQVQQSYPQQMQQNMQPVQQPVQPNTDLKWIQGEAAAKSYLVAPGQTVTLWDTESKSIYIKSANAAGMPSMMILDYVERNGAPQNEQNSPAANFATKDDVESIREEIIALRAILAPSEGIAKKEALK